MDISEKKAELRKRIRALRRDLTEAERKYAAEKVAERLLMLEPVINAKYLLAYMPMKYELDVLPAVKALDKLGKKAAFPLCTDNRGLRLLIPKKENGFVTGAYGILEPDPDGSEEITVRDLDVIILPAIGFDRNLNRLGQGGGYYDRLLSTAQCFKVAVGFDCQLVDSIPVEQTDMPTDAVITPGELILKQ